MKPHFLRQFVVEAHHFYVFKWSGLNASVEAVREFEVAVLYTKIVATHKNLYSHMVRILLNAYLADPSKTGTLT